MENKPSEIDCVRSRQQTAEILGISVRTLSRLEKSGEAPIRIKITERVTGYRDSAINKFLESRTVAA